MSGFKRVIGSWKIMAMLRPRKSRISLGDRVDKSMPSNRTVPEIRAFSGSKRKMARPRVLFPHPLSPTRPTVVPFSFVRSTSVTAWTGPSGVSKVTERPLLSKRAVRLPPSP